MKARLIAPAIVFSLFTIRYSAAQSLQWTADVASPSAASFTVYHGDALELAASVRSYGAYADLDGAAASFLWQTNGMGTSWWSAAASVVTGSPDRVRYVWNPTNDCGASAYTFFFRVAPTNGTRTYSANGALSMRASPGFVPATLPPAAPYPDLAALLVPYVQPLLSADLTRATNYTDSATNAIARSVTNEAALRVASDSALQLQITALAQCGSITGSVSTSSSSLYVVSADTNWLVGVDSGTTTLYRVSAGTNSVYDATWIRFRFSSGFGSGASSPVSPPRVEYFVEKYSVNVEDLSESGSDGWLFDGGDFGYRVQVRIGGEIVGEWRVQPAAEDEPLPQTLSVYSGDAFGTATVDHYRPEIALTTNVYESYVTLADMQQAFGAFNPAAATNAVAIASNAMAAAAAVDYRITAATNSLMRALISTNSWLVADVVSNTVSVYVIATNGVTNCVHVGGVTGIDPAATNLIWSALGGKAPNAWGRYAPDGTVNPDPAYMTWLNAPATAFASGCSWQTYGAYAALCCTGMVVRAAGSNGYCRVAADSTNYYGIAQGGSVLVGAVPNSLAVHDGGTEAGWAEIVYQYDGGDYPALYFTADLGADWTEVLTAAWTDNLDGTATVVAPAATAKGFWQARTSSVFSYVFECTMPAALRGGVIGSTNAPPVIYNSTVNVIGTDGHTYKIPARFVE